MTKVHNGGYLIVDFSSLSNLIAGDFVEIDTDTLEVLNYNESQMKKIAEQLYKGYRSGKVIVIKDFYFYLQGRDGDGLAHNINAVAFVDNQFEEGFMHVYIPFYNPRFKYIEINIEWYDNGSVNVNNFNLVG